MKRILLLFLCFLGGCATPSSDWSTLPAGQFQDNKSDFTAVVPQGWERLKTAPYFAITRDGFGLNVIIVIRQSIVSAAEGSRKKFEKSMSPQELAEVEKSYLEADSDLLKLQFFKNELAKVDGHDSAFLDYKFTTADGLEMKGQIYTFLKGELVYRIKYEAPQQYYFGKYYDDFDKFMKSFKTNP